MWSCWEFLGWCVGKHIKEELPECRWEYDPKHVKYLEKLSGGN
jgi:hypothetical protein